MNITKNRSEHSQRHDKAESHALQLLHTQAEAAEEDEEVGRHPALSVSHLHYVDAQVMRDRLYVLCRDERGTATEVVVYSIDERLARIGTLLLPVDKAASATGLSVRAAPGLLAVQECDVFLTYREHKSVMWIWVRRRRTCGWHYSWCTVCECCMAAA